MGEGGRRKHYKGGKKMFLHQIMEKSEFRNARNLKVVVGKMAALTMVNSLEEMRK